MLKFGIMLYLVSNLASCIAFVKFNAKFGIALENFFYVKMPNFSIGTQIWHCIEDALRKGKRNNQASVQQFNPTPPTPGQAKPNHTSINAQLDK